MAEKSKTVDITHCEKVGDKDVCAFTGINAIYPKKLFFFDDAWEFLTLSQKQSYSQPTLLFIFNPEHTKQFTNPISDVIFKQSLDPFRSVIGASWIIPTSGLQQTSVSMNPVVWNKSGVYKHFAKEGDFPVSWPTEDNYSIETELNTTDSPGF